MTKAEIAEFYGLTTNVHWTSTATTARTTAVTAAKQVNADEGKENAHFDLDAIRAKTAEERRRILSEIAPPLESLPDYINWVQLGAVTPVKNQAGCGSCWAFSTTGALEGAKFLKTGELVSLSEQQLLDCDHIDMGCLGGLMDNGFQFDKLNGGLCSEDDYPYVSEEHKTCRSCTPVPGSTVQTYIDVPAGDEMALVSAIAIQPVSVAVDAADPIFQFYRDGVINNDDCGSGGFVNHGVLAVGYGTDLETQEPYFLVKNSWGTAYGLNGGYVKIGRKSKNGHEWGVCAILSNRSSFPIVKA
jgi:cathepsin L